MDPFEKPPVVQILQSFPTFYETRMFITVFTRWNQSVPSHPMSLKSISILPTFLRLGLRSDVFWFSHRTPICRFLRPIRTTCPAHLILFYLLILIMLGEEYKLRSFSLCSFLQPAVTSSSFGPNILLSALFLNIFSLCSSLNVRDQVTQAYRTTIIFILLDSRREDKRFWNEW
jgi:hypothetical protein